MAKAYQMEKDKIKELVPVEELKMDIAVQKAIDLIKDSAEIVEEKAKKTTAKKTTTAKKAPAKKAKTEDAE